VISSFGFRYVPPRNATEIPFVLLEGPYTSTLDGRPGGIVLCGAAYEIVRAERDRVWVLRGGRPYRHGIAAYHRADTVIWYLDRTACTGALAEARENLAAPERLAEGVRPNPGGC
jgi:hypothetical protein